MRTEGGARFALEDYLHRSIGVMGSIRHQFQVNGSDVIHAFVLFLVVAELDSSHSIVHLFRKGQLAFFRLVQIVRGFQVIVILCEVKCSIDEVLEKLFKIIICLCFQIFLHKKRLRINKLVLVCPIKGRK